MPGIPTAEVTVTTDLVRALLQRQHPDLAHLPLSLVASGFDNFMFRLGEEYCVRLPRRQIAAQLLTNEQRWLPVLAPQLPIPVSSPLRVGKPGLDYPWHWSVLPWFEGECADISPPGKAAAETFCEFLLQLHQPAPSDAPTNPVRGGHLAGRIESFDARVAHLASTTNVITPVVQALWHQGLSASVTDHRCWLHGDLHAQNILIERGQIAAVIDWGDITAGDVATDLQSIWALFDQPADREHILKVYAPDQATLERAKAWAILMAVVMIDTGRNGSPRHEKQGRQQLQRVLQDS